MPRADTVAEAAYATEIYLKARFSNESEMINMIECTIGQRLTNSHQIL